jgi:glycine hydroxymethyltransferase
MSPSIYDLFSVLAEHERKFNSSFSLIPSENALSPLARTAFLSDAFSRYFFDEHESFGRWSFQGGSIAGQIQTDIVVPLLKDLGKAEFVNVHAVSGLTGMTLALAAFGGPPGSSVVSVPPEYGGHPDTSYVADKLGYRVEKLPFSDWRAVDT